MQFINYRNLGFEIYSKHGISSGVLICETVKKKQELLKQINNVIKNCNLEYVSKRELNNQ